MYTDEFHFSMWKVTEYTVTELMDFYVQTLKLIQMLYERRNAVLTSQTGV